VDTECGTREKTKKVRPQHQDQGAHQGLPSKALADVHPVILTPDEGIDSYEPGSPLAFDAFQIHRGEDGVRLEAINEEYSQSGIVRHIFYSIYNHSNIHRHKMNT